MTSILQYFDLIAGVMENSEAESAEVDFEQFDQTNGVVDAMLYFDDQSRLEFAEVVAIQNHRPVKLVYRYQYVRSGREEFRYDNAAHHPDLLNFPHHKHVGAKKLPAAEPSLRRVLDEITALQRTATVIPSESPKRRRQTKRSGP